MANPLMFILFSIQFWLCTATNLVGRNNALFFFMMVTSNWIVGKLFSLLQCLMSDVVHSFFRFYETNAYWLQMTTDIDMKLASHDIATANFKIVRTWAFNDVLTKPSFWSLLPSNAKSSVLPFSPLFYSGDRS